MRNFYLEETFRRKAGRCGALGTGHHSSDVGSGCCGGGTQSCAAGSSPAGSRPPCPAHWPTGTWTSSPDERNTNASDHALQSLNQVKFEFEEANDIL